MKIAVFVGSLQKNSYNKNLARALEKAAPEGVEFAYIDAMLPLFSEDLEKTFPVEAQKIKNIVQGSDGVLFVTPEYNRSIPGVLKNAIDWTSRPWGDNSFQGKPAGIVGATLNVVGTGAAQAELRNVLSYLGMRVMNVPEIYMTVDAGTFAEDGTLADQRWQKNIEQYIQAFAEWVQHEK